jgi:hypothetical protein
MKNIKDNKKNMVFLLVWDKDSYTKRFLALLPCTCVLQPTLVASLPDLFTTSWSPSHSGLCQFKITIFSPVQWVHQPHSSFLVSFPFPIFLMHGLPLMCEPCPIYSWDYRIECDIRTGSQREMVRSLFIKTWCWVHWCIRVKQSLQ